MGLDDGKFWMCIKDFVKHSAGVEYARTFGPNWKKISQYKHFLKRKLIGTAQSDFKGKSAKELSFSKGDKIFVTSFCSNWWQDSLKEDGKAGFFPPDCVKLNDRPVAAFELCGTPDANLKGDMTAVVMLLQPNSSMERKWYKRKEDGLNYKDQSYACLQLCVIAPDGSVALKKEAKKRCVWGELKLPGGGKWRIYALSVDGTGSEFTVRAFIKDGTATMKEIPDAKLSDLTSSL